MEPTYEAVSAAIPVVLFLGMLLGAYFGLLIGIFLGRPNRSEKVVLRAALDHYLSESGEGHTAMQQARVLRYGPTLRE